MHELAIADSIARIAREHCGGRPVEKVRVRVGHLRQVVPASLGFCFELTTRGTDLEGAALEIQAVPVVARCRDCAADGPQPRFPFRCASCGSRSLDVLEGEELYVDSLVLGDCAEPAAAIDRPGTRRIVS